MGVVSEITRRHSLTENFCFSGSYSLSALSSAMAPGFRSCFVNASIRTRLHILHSLVWLSVMASFYCREKTGENIY